MGITCLCITYPCIAGYCGYCSFISLHAARPIGHTSPSSSSLAMRDQLTAGHQVRHMPCICLDCVCMSLYTMHMTAYPFIFLGYVIICLHMSAMTLHISAYASTCLNIWIHISSCSVHMSASIWICFSCALLSLLMNCIQVCFYNTISRLPAVLLHAFYASIVLFIEDSLQKKN